MVRVPLHSLRSFEPEDAPDERRPPTPAVEVAGKVTFLVGRHGTDLESLIPALHQGHAYHMPTRGEWSLHEMLAFLLNRIGPAQVWITSWGISQEPLKAVLQMKLNGQITKLHCFFDTRIKLECPQAFQLLLAAEDVVVKLGKNHSKLLVLVNERWGVTVAASANLTVNPRLEYYTIDTHRDLAEQNMTWISIEMDGGQPFDSE